MADYDLKRLSELPQASTLNPWDVIPIVQAGVTKIVSAEKFGSGGGGGSLSADSDTGTITVQIPARRMLGFFVIRTAGGGTFDLGLTPGGAEKLAAEPLTAGVWSTYSAPIFGGDLGQNLYFENLTGFAEVILFLLA